MSESISSLRLEQAPGSSIAIPRGEIFRYLGYRRIAPTPEVTERVEACAARLNAQSAPKAAWRVFPLGHGADADDLLRAAGIEIHSRGLSRNCRDCTALVMLAVTIGPGCDFLIRRAEAVSMTDAAIYQAAGAAMVEEWCDTVNARIRDEMLRQYGYRARPRFSPGYGDLPLSLQKDFFRILNLPKSCGMSLGDTLLMSPSKSVTAFIGLKPGEDADCVPAGCEVCGESGDCDYRRE